MTDCSERLSVQADDIAMKFCYNCGAALSGTEKFCGRCGARLEHKVKAEDAEKSIRHGLIFTDLNVLSMRTGAEKNRLELLFSQYAEAMCTSGIRYRLVDASDYTFVSAGVSRKGEKADIRPGSPWWHYQLILYDVMCYEKENSMPESNYLFIIGSDDVIPVAVIDHYIKEEGRFKDKDIDTDLLYAYPYGREMKEALESLQIYKLEMYYLTGRLPIPSDAGIGYLTNYLQNAINVSKGIKITKAYAQSDPHWKELTAHLMSPFDQAGILPDRSNISGHYSYGNVLLGPDITSRYIAAVMDKDTDLIYLNLHGSNVADAHGYMGEYPEMTKKFEEIFPTIAMSIPQGYNIFVAEACYGGRFIGYDTLHSMIQSGLAHKTVLGLASSRIAFGVPRPPAGCADVICSAFLDYLFKGYSAGEAMVLARRMFFEGDKVVSEVEAVTLAEFRLFGDPSLHAFLEGEKAADKSSAELRVASDDYQAGYDSRDVRKPGHSSSLLDMVRAAVDDNIRSISERIGEELYRAYGLPPREPETVKRVKFRNGQERLLFSYYDECQDESDRIWKVISYPDGKIEKVLTSK